MAGLRDTWHCAVEPCLRYFPCLSDPARRTSICLKVALVMMHLVFVGIIFFFDEDLIDKTKKQPWYTALYLFLFVATLVQYFLTAGSSPGYVVDAMRATNEADALYRNTVMASNKENLLQAKIEALLSQSMETNWIKAF